MYKSFQQQKVYLEYKEQKEEEKTKYFSLHRTVEM